MLWLYLSALGFGGSLIGASFFFGGDADKDLDKDFDVDHDGDLDLEVDGDLDTDFEVDGDVDMDVDADADADLDVDKDFDVGPSSPSAVGDDIGGAAAVLRYLPFTSMRFWSFGTFCFGLAGTLLELMLSGTTTVLVLAATLGLGIGTVMAWAFRYLKSDAATGEVKLDRFINRDAKVIVPIRPGETGKIAFQTLGGRVELLARSRDDAIIEAGTTVLCAHIDGGGVALVTSLPDLDGKPQRAAQSKSVAIR